eukprot:1161373-Pelagomonas_calceolata.AAC.16
MHFKFRAIPCWPAHLTANEMQESNAYQVQGRFVLAGPLDRKSHANQMQGKSVLAGPLGCVDSMPAAPAPSSEPPSPTPMPVHASKPPGLSMVPGSREQPEQGKHSPWGKISGASGAGQAPSLGKTRASEQ